MEQNPFQEACTCSAEVHCHVRKWLSLVPTAGESNTGQIFIDCFKIQLLCPHPHLGFTKILFSFKQAPWPESASELYLPSDRRLSVKLVPTFAERGVSRSQHDGCLRPYSRFSRPKPLLFLPSSSLNVFTKLRGLRSRPTTYQKIW
jgi:hypothetical protein